MVQKSVKTAEKTKTSEVVQKTKGVKNASVEPKTTEKKTKKKPVNKRWKRTGMTVMQTRAVKELTEKVEKGGKVVLREVLEDVWYAPNTAKTPQKVFGKPAVVKKLKELKITPDWLQSIHEEFMNAYTHEVYRYSILIPEENIIESITQYIKGAKFLKCYTNAEYWVRFFEFLIPDRNARKVALELWYKIFPPKQWIDPERVKAANRKRLDKINELKLKWRLKLNLSSQKTQ